MKTWTMPHVEIEQFRTNEFVAACPVTPSIDVTKGKYAVDFWSYNENNNSYTAVTTGVADGKYQTSRESCTNGQLPSIAPPAGVYTGKTLYEIIGTTYNNAPYATETRIFTKKADNVTVWVVGGVTLYVYPDGTDPHDFNPDTGKNWS